jgi:hypothetical protein
MVRWGRRLVKRWEESQMTDVIGTRGKGSVSEQIESELVRREREQCCKDICYGCWNGYKIERKDEDIWKHLTLGRWLKCEAWKIHERAWQQEHNDQH